MFSFWIGNDKPRRTCNASVALSFLKHRDNDGVADRRAILANLCGYSLRLNTVELERSQSRLSVCTFALNIANGDFSLLSPESYHIPRGINISMFVQTVHTTTNRCFLTVNSPEQRRHRIHLGSSQRDVTLVYQIENCRSWRGDSRPSLPYLFSGNKRWALNPGLNWGFMWKIDHFVELASIKHKYRESWARLWRPSTRLKEQSLEATEEPYRFHKVSRVHWLAVTQIIFELIELLRAETRQV